MAGQLDKVLTKNSVKMLQQYHSGLEHTFLWIVDAQDAYSVQNFMVESGWIKFNALKIVPLTSYQTVIEICQSIGTWLKAEAQSLESDVSHKQLARHLSELYHWEFFCIIAYIYYQRSSLNNYQSQDFNILYPGKLGE